MRRLISIMLMVALAASCFTIPTSADSHPFTDVPTGNWFEEAVVYCYLGGLINGMSKTTFGPDTNMTRGMLVTVLHRMEGEPASNGVFPFYDVAEGIYYRAPVHWAYNNGVVNGVTDTSFAPENNINREQMVTIFYRYAGIKGLDTSPRADLSGYGDNGQISGYAADAFQWAVATGIITGMTTTELGPQGLATRAQCATMLMRLHKLLVAENSAQVLSAEKDAELHADLQNRIHEILFTDNEIAHSDTFIPGKTYTGTAYYVSNDGDDNNDGLTPETAWKNITQLIYEIGSSENKRIQPGDAVFLRRGDIFRIPDEFCLGVGVDSLTFSAYGEGEKPIITSSTENGSGSEKWELYEKDTSGAKIWKYYRDMDDIGMVVCNDGEAIATRVYEYWDGNGYISCIQETWSWDEPGGVTLMDRLYTPLESLTADMTIISRPIRTVDVMGSDTGPLYLRCDAGNPGELYDSIEFSEYELMGQVWLQASNTVWDNINFQCNGNSFFKNGIDFQNLENTLIQNCEFAYCGGSVTNYYINEDGDPYVGPQGDGIYGIVENTTIRNNYFHDCCASVTTYEGYGFPSEPLHGSYLLLDNVLVDTFGFRLDSSTTNLKHLESVVIRGNQIWNTGNMSQKYSYAQGSIYITHNMISEILIEENVLYGTENGHTFNALLCLLLCDDAYPWYQKPLLRNNVFVQHSERNFCQLFTENYYEAWAMNDPLLKSKIAGYLGDTTSEFYIMK